MSAEEIKLIYESLIASGDLDTMFPNMKGDWELDRKEFVIQYNSTERLLQSLEDDDLDDLDDLDDSDTYEYC